MVARKKVKIRNWEVGIGKEEGSSATDSVTDVTDVTDVSPMEFGRRKKGKERRKKEEGRRKKGVERRKYVYLFNLISSILLKS